MFITSFMPASSSPEFSKKPGLQPAQKWNMYKPVKFGSGSGNDVFVHSNRTNYKVDFCGGADLVKRTIHSASSSANPERRMLGLIQDKINQGLPLNEEDTDRLSSAMLSGNKFFRAKVFHVASEALKKLNEDKEKYTRMGYDILITDGHLKEMGETIRQHNSERDQNINIQINAAIIMLGRLIDTGKPPGLGIPDEIKIILGKRVGPNNDNISRTASIYALRSAVQAKKIPMIPENIQLDVIKAISSSDFPLSNVAIEALVEFLPKDKNDKKSIFSINNKFSSAKMDLGSLFKAFTRSFNDPDYQASKEDTSKLLRRASKAGLFGDEALGYIYDQLRIPGLPDEAKHVYIKAIGNAYEAEIPNQVLPEDILNILEQLKPAPGKPFDQFTPIEKTVMATKKILRERGLLHRDPNLANAEELKDAYNKLRRGKISDSQKVFYIKKIQKAYQSGAETKVLPEDILKILDDILPAVTANPKTLTELQKAVLHTKNELRRKKLLFKDPR